MSATTASPRRVAAGRINAAKRWADPATRKIVRLDALTTEQRAVVLALVEAAHAATKGATATNGDALEVRDVRHATPTP